MYSMYHSNHVHVVVKACKSFIPDTNMQCSGQSSAVHGPHHWLHCNVPSCMVITLTPATCSSSTTVPEPPPQTRTLQLKTQRPSPAAASVRASQAPGPSMALHAPCQRTCGRPTMSERLRCSQNSLIRTCDSSSKLRRRVVCAGGAPAQGEPATSAKQQQRVLQGGWM